MNHQKQGPYVGSVVTKTIRSEATYGDPPFPQWEVQSWVDGPRGERGVLIDDTAQQQGCLWFESRHEVRELIDALISSLEVFDG